MDQKRIICALHFLSVDLSSSKVQELLMDFIHNELKGKTFKIGKQIIIDDGEFTQSFSKVFNSFDDESVNGYYSIMTDIRSSVIDLVTEDVIRHYKLTFSDSTRPLLKDTISKLIKFNLSNPKKVNSNPTWFNMPNQLSLELFDVLDISSKVKMIKHGEFTKSAQKHLSGQGCFRCGVEALVADGSLPGGYNKSLFENNADISNRNASLYYLSINNGEMYKIGISQNLTRRIDGIKCKSAGYIKSVELILKEDTYLYDAYRREQDILKQFEKYRTQTSFSTELFSVDISKNSKFKNIFYGSNKN